MPRLSQTRAYVALFLIASLWGTFPATSKLALADIPPTLLTTIRCAVAAALLSVLVLRSGFDAARELTPEAVRAFFVLGVCGFVISTQITYWGIYTTSAANAAILQAAAPVMLALGARAYRRVDRAALSRHARRRRAPLVGVALTTGGRKVVRPPARD